MDLMPHRGFEKPPRQGMVTIDRIVVTKLPRIERAIVIALAASMPRRLTTRELIECVYPDPDLEPDWASRIIQTTIARIRKSRKLDGWTIKSHSTCPGYWLEKV